MLSARVWLPWLQDLIPQTQKQSNESHDSKEYIKYISTSPGFYYNGSISSDCLYRLNWTKNTRTRSAACAGTLMGSLMTSQEMVSFHADLRLRCGPLPVFWLIQELVLDPTKFSSFTERPVSCAWTVWIQSWNGSFSWVMFQTNPCLCAALQDLCSAWPTLLRLSR